MSKDNVTKIKDAKKTQCFSYEVLMLVHIIADDETTAKNQLDEKGEPYYVYFEKATVQAIAHQFFKKNLQHTTNLQHEIPVTGVTVVESWIKEGKQDKSMQLGLSELPDGTWFIGTHVDDDSVWQDVKEGKVKGYSIEGFFNEVGVAMSGVKNYEAELLLEIDQLLSTVNPSK